MAGDTQATITFGAPWNTGGTPITGYTVTSNPGGVTATGTGSPIVVTGLTNNTAYTFTVTASNSVGPGPASGPSNSVTPKGVVTTAPGPPSGVWATAGNARATVNFSAPWNTGGTTIISYTVTSSPGGIAKTGYRSPIVVTGLTNGVAYTFTVKATNIVGTGAASMPSRAVTPTDGVVLTVPGPPTGVSATAGNTNATITFSAPADTGGTPITGYTVTGSPGGTATGVGSPITVTGLTNGTGYTFTVKATNIVGTGPASTASNSVTPAAPVLTVPGAPTGVSATAGNARATVTFSAPADTGGTPIIEYRIYGYKNGLLDLSYSYGDPGGVSPVPWTFEGLTNGASYTFTVTARNSVGDSPSSAPSSAVIPSP
jgi:hypothetical protein